MSGTARVSHLRLVADDQALVHRGALLVEDALRIASLGARDDARLFIVRRLDLGTIDPDASSQTLALAIEDRAKRIEQLAVPADSPEAVGAPIVVFPDEPTALARLVARLIAGPPPGEWYWRHVAGDVARQGDPIAIARACIAQAIRAASGPLAVALIVEAAERARSAELVKVIAPAEGAQLIALTFGAAIPPRAAVPAPAIDVAPALALLGSTWRERIATWIARTGGDLRSVWFAAVALAHVRRAVIAPARALEEAREVVAMIRRAHAERAQVAEAAITARAQRPEPALAAELPRQVAAAAGPVADDAPPAAAPPPSPPVREASPAKRPARRADGAAGEHTQVGGLLFLVAPLRRLGLAEWLARTPWAADVQLPGHLLADIARRCGAADDDPLVAALLPSDAPELPPSRAWAVAAWRRAAAGWSRRRLETTLRGIVRRPGLVRATRLHLDIDLPLVTVDLKTRAAGLDLNPGWVPWLGRVIAFGYRSDLRWPS